MDVKKTTAHQAMDLWTNEKHLNYLNFMEASFVRKMFRNIGARSTLTCAAGEVVLPLDRQIPDCFESTRDLKLTEGKRKEMNEKKKMSRRNEKSSTRRRSSRPYDSSPDQVVPQIVGKSTKSDNEDERHKQ